MNSIKALTKIFLVFILLASALSYSAITGNDKPVKAAKEWTVAVNTINKLQAKSPSTSPKPTIELLALDMMRDTQKEPGWIYYHVDVGIRVNSPMVVTEIPLKNGYVVTSEGPKYEVDDISVHTYIGNDKRRSGSVRIFSNPPIDYRWYDGVVYIPGIVVFGSVSGDTLENPAISFKVPEKLTPKAVYFDGLPAIDLTNLYLAHPISGNIQPNGQIGVRKSVINNIDVTVSYPRITYDDYRGKLLTFDTEFRNNDITADRKVHIGLSFIDDEGIVHTSPSNVCGKGEYSPFDLSSPVKVGPGQTTRVISCFEINNTDFAKGDIFVNLSSLEGRNYNYVATYKVNIASIVNDQKIPAKFTPTSPQVKTPTPTSRPPSNQRNSSCKGAPPQRMTVGKQGYVCTQSDHVRLRSGPSTNTKILKMLSPGILFTVINGPTCANSGTFWQIRTVVGDEGWILEGEGDPVDPYFICPIP